MRRTAAVVVVALLAGVAGCSALPLPELPSTTVSPVADECQIDDVAFDVNGGERWAPDLVRVRYRLTGSPNLFLVALEGNQVLGVKHVRGDAPGKYTDVPLHLDRNLSGVHTLVVQVYADQNRDGRFVRTDDLYCEDRMGPHQTNPLMRNFSTYAHGNAS